MDKFIKYVTNNKFTFQNQGNNLFGMSKIVEQIKLTLTIKCFNKIMFMWSLFNLKIILNPGHETMSTNHTKLNHLEQR